MLPRVALQATDDEARSNLIRIVQEQEEDYAGLSRMIGRPAGYLNRYVRKGSPKRLEPRDQEMLGAYFQIQPQRLGAPM